MTPVATSMQDIARELQDAVVAAAAAHRPINIVGGNSKQFLGRIAGGEPLAVSAHSGIVNYEPVELVITARAGTPMRDLEAALSAAGQMLPFEPPHFGDHATLGGTIACGLSGPRRPYAGAARDYVLGVRLINGRGDILKFGGEVMKNVAGYDVSRLMTGAMGTLGVLLDISLKVLPRPHAELTVVQQRPPAAALGVMQELAMRPLPLSAMCYDGDQLYLRLSGAATAVDSACRHIGGDLLNDGSDLWQRVREQRHAFFQGPAPLWRVSLPAGAPALDLAGKWFLDWGGAQRWLKGEARPHQLRASVAAAGGHATLCRSADRTGEVFHPLSAGLMALHRNIKQAFDPHGILNPGRIYKEW